jgi:hypothetical protein
MQNSILKSSPNPYSVLLSCCIHTVIIFLKLGHKIEPADLWRLGHTICMPVLLLQPPYPLLLSFLMCAFLLVSTLPFLAGFFCGSDTVDVTFLVSLWMLVVHVIYDEIFSNIFLWNHVIYYSYKKKHAHHLTVYQILHTHTHTYTHTHTRTHTHTHTHSHSRTRTRARAHTHTHNNNQYLR